MKHLTLALLSIGVAATTQGESAHTHCLSPKAFYRYHAESGYNYKSAGIGLSYHLEREMGLGVDVSYINNLKEIDGFAETQTSFFYKIPTESFIFSPILSFNALTHRRNNLDEKPLYISKGSVAAGLGIEKLIKGDLFFTGEIQIFQETHNSMVVVDEDTFWGKSFYNPAGAKAVLGFKFDDSEKKYFYVKTSYAHTFKKCFKECEVQLGYHWRF